MTCTYPDLLDWGGRKPADAEDSAALDAEAFAWTSFLQLAAGRLAVCPITVRPVTPTTWQTWVTSPAGTWPGSNTEIYRLPQDAALHQDALFGMGFASHKRQQLPRPVGQIVSVVIDGATLGANQYRLDDGVLVRVDGDEWPIAQDLEAASGSVGVWEVTYYRGYRPSLSVVRAVGVLAYEFYLGFSGSNKTRLPERVTAVTRQGVSFQMPANLFDDGRTGIREVDQVLRRYNPNGLKQATVIASPDTLRRQARKIG